MPLWFSLLTHGAILAAALVGGVFLAFSDFIMRALARTPGNGGPDAMRAINREVFRYVFIPMFLALVPVTGAIALAAVLLGPAPAFFVAAAVVYALGVFGVTAAQNVPMNNTLADLPPGSPDDMAYWRDVYQPRWTLWNGVRCLACLLCAALLMAGLAYPGGA